MSPSLQALLETPHTKQPTLLFFKKLPTATASSEIISFKNPIAVDLPDWNTSSWPAVTLFW